MIDILNSLSSMQYGHLLGSKYLKNPRIYKSKNQDKVKGIGRIEIIE